MFAAESTVGFPILTALVLVPLVGAAVVALLPRSRADTVRLVGVLFAVATAALSVYLLVAFKSSDGGMQFVSQHSWVKAWGISWHLGVDGISVFLLALTGILFPIALWGSDPHHDLKPYTAWILLLEAGTLGAFMSLDLLVFFLFFEIVLVPMYMLIGGWGYDRRVYASTKFFLYTMAGSALLLVGIFTVAFLHKGGPTFDIVTLAQDQSFSVHGARWLFLAFAGAFAVKVPLFPLHTWLPDAHTQAPTAGSVILAGVMLKLGTYGFLRFGLYLFPEASRYFRPVFLTLGVIGIIYGAVVATVQKDLKRLVAYSSVAHLGFIILGTFAMTTPSITGGVLQAVNHGISTPALFLLVGMIYERRHTRQISELQGLQRVAPIFAATFTVVMLSSIGLPGLNGFVGKFMILIGSFLTARWWVVVAATGVILAALYLLWAYQRVFHGEPQGDNRTFKELTLREGLVMAPLIAIIVFTGIYPKPLLDRIEPSVTGLGTHVSDKTGYVEPKPTPAPAAQAATTTETKP